MEGGVIIMSDKIFSTLSEVTQEIDAHDLNTFESLSVESEVIRLAAEYLHKADKSPMADYLEKLADAGRIRLGPVQGFAAAAYLKDGQDYIILSNQYEPYNTRHERVIHLAHEIHFTSPFALPQEENEMLELSILQWLKKREDGIKKAFERIKSKSVELHRP